MCRCVPELSHNVPKGLIQARDSAGEDRATSEEAGLPKALPVSFDGVRTLTQQQRDKSRSPRGGVTALTRLGHPASPQPTTPVSVSTLTNSQRGGTRKVSIFVMRA